MSGKLVFSPIQIGSLTLKNRIMRSATHEAMSTIDGHPTANLLNLIKELANGDVGLIVSGYFYAMKKGQSIHKQNGITSKEHGKEWRETADYIHSKGSKIVFQVAHCGLSSHDPSVEKVGPSPLIKEGKEVGRSLTIAEIEEIIDSFVNSAKIAEKEANVDGIQLHCAHGFLFSEFLSPSINRRTDKYGGSDENRVRIVQETVNEIRKATNNDTFSVSMKMNGSEFLPASENGLTAKDASRHVSLLKNVDFFEISSSQACRMKPINETEEERKKNPFPYFDNFNLDLAETIKRNNPHKIIATVGGLRNIEDFQDILRFGKSDLISMSRPFLRQPHLVKDMISGKISKADCVSCGLCLINAVSSNKEVHCCFPDLKK